MARIKQTIGWGLVLLCAVWLPPSWAEELETIPVARVELPRVYRLDGVAEAVNRSTVSAQTSRGTP